jgi:nucleotide-binding universal stress UspA family protein
LRLVEVIAERVEPAPFASVGNVQMEVEYAETALRLAAAAVAAAGKPVKVETAILRGDSAAKLIAESRNAERVCVGSVGIGRFAKALLGSTAAELAEAAHCPVAIIRTQQRRPKPDSAMIVVAVNSPGNDDVIEQAVVEAQLRHAPVLALGEWRDDLGEMPYDELDRRVQFWNQRYPSVKIHAAATRTGIADFLDVMSDRRIQLAVIGCSDRDQVARLIGPHRHPILGHAECSVLIVRS